MNRKLLVLAALIFLFSFKSQVFADNGHNHQDYLRDAIESSENRSNDRGAQKGTDSQDHSHPVDSEVSHIDHGEAEEEKAGEGPNFKVLGTFGAINLSFIDIGVWNKWIRRKGE